MTVRYERKLEDITFLNLQKGIIASFYILIPVFIIGESCYNYILHIIKYLIKIIWLDRVNNIA